jgi:hypothetical protein
MSRWLARLSAWIVIGIVGVVAAQPARQGALLPGARIHLHAHNCYPEAGRWSDRMSRALGAGAPHLAIEQDLVWVPARSGRPGRSVVAHDAPAAGDEPTLDDHFFARVRPMMEEALRAPRPDTWPLLVLHLDFKTNEPEHHAYVWTLLGQHPQWLTTAVKRPADEPPSPLQPGPLLVLTEHGDGQERDFHDRHPIGSALRLFGTVPPDAVALPEEPLARAAALVAMTPSRLIPSSATSYRRWTNHGWNVIEAGGAPRAGDWAGADAARLREIVARAHDLGLWLRVYGVNGYADEGRGWSAGYNFGSAAQVQQRWRAAIDARVDFIATDQYELFAAELAAHTP